MPSGPGKRSNTKGDARAPLVASSARPQSAKRNGDVSVAIASKSCSVGLRIGVVTHHNAVRWVLDGLALRHRPSGNRHTLAMSPDSKSKTR